MCDLTGVIKISDDSSTDSDMGLDSDFNSSPESMFETDDVIFVEHTFNGFAGEDRSEQGRAGLAAAPALLGGAGVALSCGAQHPAHGDAAGSRHPAPRRAWRSDESLLGMAESRG